MFKIADAEKPLTRRGLLSTVNSIFDLLGFVSPGIIRGKILLREIVTSGNGWDDELAEHHSSKWHEWLTALKSMDNYCISRVIVQTSVSLAKQTDIHVCSDASHKTIAAVAYLRVVDEYRVLSVGFLMGKFKLAPLKGHTIPRWLEFYGAVLASEIGETVATNLNISLDRS